MDILLIRHGETPPGSRENFSTEKGRPDPALNSTGRQQTALLGRKLAGFGIQRIYASDLKRTVKTAEILNGYLHVPIEIRQELREIDMGRLHFCTWEKIKTEDEALFTSWHRHDADLPYPDGESGGEAAARAMKVIMEITECGLDKVAVVTHGGIIRILVCAVLGVGQEKRFKVGPPENTSVSIIRYDVEKKEFSVVGVNDASHLV